MGSILKLDRRGHSRDSVTLVVGCQEIRKATFLPLYDYMSDNNSKRINALVNCIHFAREKLDNGYLSTVYYSNCYNHFIQCMNDSIINLLESDVNIYVTTNGAIIFWGEHDLYSTIDMQQLNFHSELNAFFKHYKIVDIYPAKDGSNRDCISISPLAFELPTERKLTAIIDLSDNCPVKITFNDWKLWILLFVSPKQDTIFYIGVLFGFNF